MRDEVIARLNRRFDAYADLIDTITPDRLTATVDVPKHKTLAEHFWCVVGARESYARAIHTGAWDGFACSMDTFELADFKASLASSASKVQHALDDVQDWHAAREELLATLAEHEVMHEGQIIRHMYALGESLPDSWTWA